jgi:hypothetical protein
MMNIMPSPWWQVFPTPMLIESPSPWYTTTTTTTTPVPAQCADNNHVFPCAHCKVCVCGKATIK